MIKFWKRHSLSIVLMTTFLIMFAASWPLGKSTWDGKGEYWVYFCAQTIWSIQGDMFGGFMLVVYTKWFKEYRSAASNDTMDEIAEKVVDEMEEQNIKVCK